MFSHDRQPQVSAWRNFLILAQGRRTPGYCSLAGLGVQRSKFRKSEATGTCWHKPKEGNHPQESWESSWCPPESQTVMPYMHRPRLHDSSCEQPPGTCKLTTTRDLTNGRFSHSNQLKWKGPAEQTSRVFSKTPRMAHSCFCSMTGDSPQQSLKISLEWIKLIYKMNSLKNFKEGLPPQKNPDGIQNVQIQL